jgi:hypothetical protein
MGACRPQSFYVARSSTMNDRYSRGRVVRAGTLPYADFVQGISSRFYQPLMKPHGFELCASMFARLGVSLEILNTRLPDSDPAGGASRSSAEFRACPCMRFAAMVDRGVAEMPSDQCFVNVGVWHGLTLWRRVQTGMRFLLDKTTRGTMHHPTLGTVW